MTDEINKTMAIIVPCFNEVSVLETFYQELTNHLNMINDIDFKIIFVNDGSTDRSLEVLNSFKVRDERVLVVSLSRNFGHQYALSAGIDKSQSDAIITMDCDLQHPPKLIRPMIEKWKQGNDIVMTVRETTDGVSIIKNYFSKLFYSIFNWMSDTKIVPAAADFYLLSNNVVECLKMMPEHHRFLRGMISWLGFKRVIINYRAAARASGHSKYNFLRMLSFASDAIFSFSAKPIRIMIRVGAVVFIFGFGYMIYSILQWYFVGNTEPGWSSIIVLITLFCGLQIIFIGLVGEYVSRIYEEVKQRPNYIINDNNSTISEQQK